MRLWKYFQMKKQLKLSKAHGKDILGFILVDLSGIRLWNNKMTGCCCIISETQVTLLSNIERVNTPFTHKTIDSKHIYEYCYKLIHVIHPSVNPSTF